MDVLVSRYVAGGVALLRACTVIVVKLARTVFGVLEIKEIDVSRANCSGFSLFFALLFVSFCGTPTTLLHRGGGGH